MMEAYHARRELRKAGIFVFEEGAQLLGLLLLVVGVIVAMAHEDVAGSARLLGILGLAAIGSGTVARAVGEYRAGVAASLPTSVARVRVRAHPRRTFAVATVALALGLPLAAAVALVAAFVWGWLAVGCVLLLGCFGAFLTWIQDAAGAEEPQLRSSTVAAELLERLCMRAGMRAPRLVVAPGPLATPGRPAAGST